MLAQFEDTPNLTLLNGYFASLCRHFVAVAAILLLVVGTTNADMVYIPGGMRMHRDCIFEVASGSRLTKKLRAQLESCRPSNGVTQQIYAQDVHAQRASPLWTNFTADWVAPALPSAAEGQVRCLHLSQDV